MSKYPDWMYDPGKAVGDFFKTLGIMIIVFMTVGLISMIYTDCSTSKTERIQESIDETKKSIEQKTKDLELSYKHLQHLETKKAELEKEGQ
jgi:hypothetical protein